MYKPRQLFTELLAFQSARKIIHNMCVRGCDCQSLFMVTGVGCSSATFSSETMR